MAMSNGTHLGRRNTNFRTGIDVNTAVSFARKCGSDSVDNTDAKGSALHAVTKSEDGIRRLTTLAEEDNDIITEDRSFAIQGIRSELDANEDLSQLLEDGVQARSDRRLMNIRAHDLAVQRFTLQLDIRRDLAVRIRID